MVDPADTRRRGSPRAAGGAPAPQRPRAPGAGETPVQVDGGLHFALVFTPNLDILPQYQPEHYAHVGDLLQLPQSPGHPGPAPQQEPHRAFALYHQVEANPAQFQGPPTAEQTQIIAHAFEANDNTFRNGGVRYATNRSCYELNDRGVATFGKPIIFKLQPESLGPDRTSPPAAIR